MKKARSFRFLFLFFFLSLTGNILGQNQNPLLGPQPDLQKQWVDSIYDQMSLEQKVGQLFMIDVNSGGSDYQKEQVEKLVQEHHVGGIIFSKGGPLQQAHLNNRLQEIATVPLLIGMDAEWGLAMRLDSINAFPWNMTLGAIQDLRLVEQTGAAISKNLKRLGVHMNFAPVLDINTNPSNPIIGNRSFGENKENVSQKASAFLKGMNRENILASGKHFPGHGDTNTDSHETLPTVGFPEKRLDSVELHPYRQLINQGLPGVMVGHLSVPALEKNQHLPASLSKSVVTELLKEKLGFHGLIITDALNMKGASSINAAPGGVSLAAFMAGNDILLMPKSISKATQAIINAYKNGVISEDRLRYSVEKILYAKYKVGLHEYFPVDTRYLLEELNTINNKALNHQLFEHSLTVVKNRKKLIPVKDLQGTRIAFVNLGDGEGSPFYEQLTKYGKVDWIKYNRLEGLLEKLQEYNRVIIGFHKSNASPWGSFRFTENELNLLQEISRKNNVILSIFTSPYALQQIESLSSIEGIVVGYQNHPLAQEKAAQVIFGGLEAKGKLPVTAGTGFPEGHGLKTENLGRLTYGLPENVGVNSYKLRKIDSLINVTVEKKMAPGVQVLIARKGKVIYHKTAGYHTYEKKIPVSETDVYDLASLTKILGTLPLLIELIDKDEMDFDTRLAEIIPSFEGSNKAHVSIQRMLSHYARFQPWIPFHWATLNEGNNLSPKYYRDKPVPGYSTKVAEGMYIRNDMRDSIVKVIRDSDLQRKMEYRYSDLPYYLLKHFLEKTYGASLDYLTKKHFYEPLGANYTTYLPLNHFPKEQIVPTEQDKRWRNQLLHGYVHDEGAALIGGVAGHAGLFSNSNDIAKMMQMYLNGGEYGGVRFFSKETFDEFNTCHYCHEEVRRGIGFDKPQLNEAGPTCGCVSMSSFGHSGFTGTFAWADPHHEIVYVFLSNRIHPSAENNELGKKSIRSKIQEAIYDAIDY